ncbi:MAG TPA: bifunctional UDP-3-O-[3-hydroxymyristoyl] N-acetylglucosamine deacetylase/3-hydroxyacyl-ACP dehydratase [Candidatus Paceibacterota bacterium]|nr:bifunctional UDP-3-O-[3-hydroxymyristoyl] N-acetylglucosamine deacetylase/3-hydroxyacyl-ACP dehydratase [Candidatus Paceibacterota bacterium]HSA00460.1 bifunctional UDP-3-O-[3-hydroxymyristoyl] N-acetylglucosamine deacetylase/3-hydroxyacyl-ACP dehydratase [Candidatus Paceibacterota bacterium]
MLQQQTLREPVQCSGAGLHSGNRVNLTILPAPPRAGIRFRRVDLADKPEIEATPASVMETNRSTTLARGNVKVHTVEHVLSALYGMGIDNAVIELDANEPPILDGSAREFSRLLKAGGMESQPEPREYYHLSSPLHFESGETSMSVFPHDRLKISCLSSDQRNRFTQYYSIEISPDSWEREIAPARTFCFFEEIEALIRNGLIKGGSLENAVIIRDDAVLTTEPLRFNEEFVRHKILDIVGDLSLLGHPLCGHVIAVKPNHSANCELTRQILEQVRRPLITAQAFAPPPSPPPSAAASLTSPVQDGAVLDITQLMRILPHRYPFLMVDRILLIEGNRIVGRKNVTFNEPYFQGHFPVYPIMPGVLQLEAIAQVAGVLLLRQAENLGKLAFFMSAENVKWRKPVHPGDTLLIEIELLKARGKIGRAKGTCRVDDEVVSEAEVTFMMGEPPA